MRTAKTQAPQAASASTESEATDVGKMQRARKAVRTPSRSLSSVSSSAHSSDAEGSSSPNRSAKAEPTQARHAVVIDHQGSGKVVHKPDGTVVWEPAPEGADGGAPRRGGPCSPTPLKDALAASGVLLTAGSAVAGLLATHAHTVAAARAPAAYCLTTRALAGAVAHTVTAYVAGTATGMVLGPLLAARYVAGVMVRPVVVGLLVHQGVSRLKEWRCGVAGLIRKLQASDPARVLEALRALIAAASRASPRFAREFNRLKGMEVLLQKLAAALPDCPMLHLIAQALAELCKDQECRDALVSAGGVPRLVALLQHPTPAVSGCGLAALACMTDHAVAVEAIRESGGLTRLVELTASAVAAQPPAPQQQLAASPSGATTTTTATTTALAAGGPAGQSGSAAAGSAAAVGDRRAALLPSVKLLQALSLDPAGKAAIGAAGGVQVLLDVIARSQPRSEAQSEAVAALHNCLRGCPDNQRTLAALPAASEVLRGALAGLGPCWHPSKGDLHALLNVLARLQGVQEAGGFVVVQSQAAAAAAREGAGLGPAGPGGSSVGAGLGATAAGQAGKA